MNLLVTGGAGFIGSNLIRHIIDRPEIARLINLDCLTYAGHLINLDNVSHHPKYAFEKVDLRHKAAVLEVVQKHAVTHVLHLAAESHVDRSITGPGDFIHTNIIGTFHLLEACRSLGRAHSDGRLPVPSRFHRRSLWQSGANRLFPGNNALRSELALFGQQSRQRHAGARLPSHLRPAGRHHELLE